MNLWVIVAALVVVWLVASPSSGAPAGDIVGNVYPEGYAPMNVDLPAPVFFGRNVAPTPAPMVADGAPPLAGMDAYTTSGPTLSTRTGRGAF